MRYSATHKNEILEKLVGSSRSIAKKSGFEATGVDALMSAVGLTGGAFYSHFESKHALFEVLVDREMRNSSDMLAGDENSPVDHVAKCLRSYLSMAHASHPEDGCVLPTLGAEISRASPAIRGKVEQQLKRMQKSWTKRVGDGDAAWALLALCVGTLMLARVVDSDATRRNILASSRRFIEKSGASTPATQK